MLTRQVQIRNKLLSIISERKTNLDIFLCMMQYSDFRFIDGDKL